MVWKEDEFEDERSHMGDDAGLDEVAAGIDDPIILREGKSRVKY